MCIVATREQGLTIDPRAQLGQLDRFFAKSSNINILITLLVDI